MAKLKKLLEDVFQDKPQINKYEVVEGVKTFGIVGKQLYNSNIMEVAKQLSHIAEQAHTHVVSEQDDWFDKVSINKNMQSLKKSVAEFKKTAQEAHSLNQRLTGIYEDMGHVLNRYYEISEGDQGDMDNDGQNEPDDEEYLDNKDKAIKQAMQDESLDQENDFKYEPDSDKDQLSGTANKNEYKEVLDADKGPDGGGDEEDLAARDGDELGEIKKSLKNAGGVVGVPALGQMARKFTGK